MRRYGFMKSSTVRPSWLGSLLAALLLAAPASAAEPGPATDKLNTEIKAVFTGLDGKPIPLTAAKTKKAQVVLFLSFDCPNSTSYASTLAALYKEYSPKGVEFIAVCPTDEVEAVKKSKSEFKLPFMVTVDPKSEVVDAFKAVATPEAFVLDHNLVLRYRGRIDNTFSARLKKNNKTTDFDLKDAIEDLLAGKDVRTPVTRAIGCPVNQKTDHPREVTTKITYFKEVLPVLQTHCQECHRPGEVGPFSLMTYKQAVAWADDIKTFTQERKMPPWKPTSGHEFIGERKLTDAELKTLAAWADGGTPAGDPKDAPAPRLLPRLAARQARPCAHAQ